MDRTVKKNFIIDFCFTFLVFVLIILSSFVLLKYLYPFLIGGIIGFLVQKPATFLSRKIKVKSGSIALLLSVLSFLLFAGVFCFIIYRFAVFLIGFTEYFPDFFEKINTVFAEIQTRYSSIFTVLSENLNTSFDSLLGNTLNKFLTVFGDWISNFAKNIVRNAPTFFISSIVTLVATCYISKDFLHLSKFVKIMVGERLSIKLVKIKNIIVGSVFKLAKGYLILSGITFAVLYVGFLILKLENPCVIAVFISLADMLPVIGTGTVMVPWAVILILLGNYYSGIFVAVLFVITALIRNFLEPKIIGKQIGINSLFTLVAMFLGLKILGVWGLIIFPIIFIVVIKYYKDEMQEELSLKN